MKRPCKLAALLTIISLLTGVTSALADDNTLRDTLQSAFYGGAVGSLVGAALLAFAKKPADHLEYIGFGTAAGVLAGTVYGVARSARALASIDNGSVRIAMPTIMPDLAESPVTRQTIVTWRADILRGTFN